MVKSDGSIPDVSRLTWWDKNGKAVVAFLFVVWTVVAPLLFGDGHIDRDEALIIVAAIGNNLVVYIVPLNPAFKSVKTVVNFVLLILVSVQTVLADGWQLNEDLPIIIAAVVAALGVNIAPAASINQPTPVAVGTGADK